MSSQEIADLTGKDHKNVLADTVPVEALGRLLNSPITSLPSAEGPSPAFLASAEMFRALEANPQYRDLYFKDKSSDLMHTYTRLTQVERMDPAMAYERAYFIHSPENQERMKARLEKPEFIKEIEATAQKAATGSSTFRLWGLAGAGRPKNDAELGTWASLRAREFYRQNPHLTESEVLSKVESMVRASWVVDSSSQRAVQVPTGIDAQSAQAAFSDLSETLTQQYRKQSLISGDGYVTYTKVPGGSDAYRVMVNSGTGQLKGGEQIRLGQVIDRYRAKHLLTREEGMLIREAKGHMDLAASLVTAREGVMLSAYGDPAKGAGLNVGAGYNLKANAATVAADLKAVGMCGHPIKTGERYFRREVFSSGNRRKEYDTLALPSMILHLKMTFGRQDWFLANCKHAAKTRETARLDELRGTLERVAAKHGQGQT